MVGVYSLCFAYFLYPLKVSESIYHSKYNSNLPLRTSIIFMSWSESKAAWIATSIFQVIESSNHYLFFLNTLSIGGSYIAEHGYLIV